MIRSFMDEVVVLEASTVRRLYRECPAPQPVLDGHLPPADIAQKRQFGAGCRFNDQKDRMNEGSSVRWRDAPPRARGGIVARFHRPARRTQRAMIEETRRWQRRTAWPSWPR